jgi:hypothetical protein
VERDRADLREHRLPRYEELVADRGRGALELHRATSSAATTASLDRLEWTTSPRSAAGATTMIRPTAILKTRSRSTKILVRLGDDEVPRWDEYPPSDRPGLQASITVDDGR